MSQPTTTMQRTPHRSSSGRRKSSQRHLKVPSGVVLACVGLRVSHWSGVRVDNLLVGQERWPRKRIMGWRAAREIEACIVGVGVSDEDELKVKTLTDG